MDEHEFKPILQEIQDKPPNPLGRIFLWSLLILMVLITIGLYFLEVDVVVSARGKVIPDGDIKIIQSLDTGVIKKIMVREGDYVKEGQPLVEIDPTIDVADIQGKKKNLSFHKLTRERVESIISGKMFYSSENTPDYIIQKALYDKQKRYLNAVIQQKEKEIKEIEKFIESLRMDIERLNNLINILAEEEERLKELVSVGAVAEAKYKEKLKERLNLERERDLKKKQIEENVIRIEKIKYEIESIKSAFLEKLLQEAGTSLQQENILASEVEKMEFIKSKKFITSPVNGYVHVISIKTIGGVVTPAQPIMAIVPEDTPLVVEARVLNKDIGFIKPGQKVVIKVDTYDFQKYGTLSGEVKTVSPFSIEDRETGMSFYLVYIKLNSLELKAKDGNTYKIKPGMNVIAEINIGKRKVIELFLSPFIRQIDEGLKVR